MRAMRVHTLGKPMSLDDVPTPTPAPGEVLVKVHACGVNFGDTLMVKGEYQEKPKLPFSPGMEICGTVVGGEGFASGTRIASYAGSGGFAEFTTIPANRCVVVPEAMSNAQAAAFLVAYGTSHVALEHKAILRPRETLLVLGAAGGVGLTAIELGKLIGA
ncbi:MAG: alcohol dehydrogenase catalytic domain-containing protein, partial [Pseudomonadota bacterium]